MDDADQELPRTAAVFLLREDGAVLMQLRDNKPGLPHAGMWTPPGGHCDAGEPIEECARRELREETAYHASELHWLAGYRNDKVEIGPLQDLTAYWARYDGVQPVRCLEGQTVQFIKRESAFSYSIPEYLVELWDCALTASGTPGAPLQATESPQRELDSR